MESSGSREMAVGAAAFGGVVVELVALMDGWVAEWWMEMGDEAGGTPPTPAWPWRRPEVEKEGEEKRSEERRVGKECCN